MKKSVLAASAVALVLGACNGGGESYPTDWDPSSASWEAVYAGNITVSSAYSSRSTMTNTVSTVEFLGSATPITTMLVYDATANTVTFAGGTFTSTGTPGSYTVNANITIPIAGYNCGERIENTLTMDLNPDGTTGVLHIVGVATFVPTGTVGPSCAGYLQAIADGVHMGVIPPESVSDLNRFTWAGTIDFSEITQLQNMTVTMDLDMNNLIPSQDRSGHTVFAIDMVDTTLVLENALAQMRIWAELSRGI